MQVPSYSCIKGVESRGVSLSRKSSAAKPEGQRVLERKKNLAKVRMGGNTLVRMRGIFDQNKGRSYKKEDQLGFYRIVNGNEKIRRGRNDGKCSTGMRSEKLKTENENKNHEKE